MISHAVWTARASVSHPSLHGSGSSTRMRRCTRSGVQFAPSQLACAINIPKPARPTVRRPCLPRAPVEHGNRSLSSSSWCAAGAVGRWKASADGVVVARWRATVESAGEGVHELESIGVAARWKVSDLAGGAVSVGAVSDLAGADRRRQALLVDSCSYWLAQARRAQMGN